MSGMVLEGAERDLIEGCRRGERDAYRALFETYQDKIYSIALRFSGDEALAMDIAQDTFLKLFSSMVEKLPAEQRIVVVLRYTEGLAYEEIAAVVGCSMGTVASRLNRAHKTLERRLWHLKGSSHE